MVCIDCEKIALFTLCPRLLTVYVNLSRNCILIYYTRRLDGRFCNCYHSRYNFGSYMQVCLL
nr:MAG TPA: hypothetical protein [Caudoviricetes sp.]